VPGLLQTEDYPRAAITQAGLPIANPEGVSFRADVRMQRQAALSRTDPLSLWAIIDEAVLHRAAGGNDVMVGQLQRLLEAGAAANIQVQVIPFKLILGGTDSLPNGKTGRPAEGFTKEHDAELAGITGVGTKSAAC
jgi:hypothetical protein